MLVKDLSFTSVEDRFGYGFCFDNGRILARLLSYEGIPYRNISVFGHYLNEYFIDNQWMVIDGNQNAIYLKLDNMSLASYHDLLEDPFLGIRTKVYGKYRKYDILTAILNTSRFDHQRKRVNEKQIFNSNHIEQYDDKFFDIYPGEKIEYSLIDSPDYPLGNNRERNLNLTPVAIHSSLGIITHKVLLSERHKNNDFIYRSAYPIYKIKNLSDKIVKIRKSNKIIAISSQEEFISLSPITFDFRFYDNSALGNLIVYSQGNRRYFPVIHSGLNSISLGSSVNNSIIEVVFDINETNLNKSLPQSPEIMVKKTFDFERPYFQVQCGKDKCEKIWWQISPNVEFNLIIPNFDEVVDSDETVKLDPISYTFLNNNNKYFLRAKVKMNGLWSDWSRPFPFLIKKPERLNNISVRFLKEGKVKLLWKSRHQDVEYYIFGSHSKDFIPDIYFPYKILSLLEKPRTESLRDPEKFILCYPKRKS